MRAALPWLFACLATPMLGCEGRTGGEELGEDAGEFIIHCELVDTLALSDANALAPNGRTGAELLAALPDSLQTSLSWERSSSSAEVEIAGAAPQSTELELGFSVSPTPSFVFEDWAPLDAEGELALGAEVLCDDYVQTTLDLSAHTADGALAIDLANAKIRLGPDHPDFGVSAVAFIQETRELASPVVSFIAPVEQAADGDKTLTITFDAEGVSGALTAYATTSDETHSILVARW